MDRYTLILIIWYLCEINLISTFSKRVIVNLIYNLSFLPIFINYFKYNFVNMICEKINLSLNWTKKMYENRGKGMLKRKFRNMIPIIPDKTEP